MIYGACEHTVHLQYTTTAGFFGIEADILLLTSVVMATKESVSYQAMPTPLCRHHFTSLLSFETQLEKIHLGICHKNIIRGQLSAQ